MSDQTSLESLKLASRLTDENRADVECTCFGWESWVGCQYHEGFYAGVVATLDEPETFAQPESALYQDHPDGTDFNGQPSRDLLSPETHKTDDGTRKCSACCVTLPTVSLTGEQIDELIEQITPLVLTTPERWPNAGRIGTLEHIDRAKSDRRAMGKLRDAFLARSGAVLQESLKPPALTRDQLIEALQDAWGDWVGDTGTIPGCFDIHGPHTTRLFADFSKEPNFLDSILWRLNKYRRNCPVCGREERYEEEPGDFGSVIGGEWVHSDDGSMECEVTGDAERIVSFPQKKLGELQDRCDALQAKVSEARLLALAAATRSYADDMRSDLGEIVAVLSTNDRINLTADLEGEGT